MDDDGKVIEPSMEYLSVVTRCPAFVFNHNVRSWTVMDSCSQPLPFKCDIRPRHSGVKALIRAAIDSDGEGMDT